MVRDAKPRVRGIRLGEAVHEIDDAVRPVDPERSRATGAPGLQVELAELADVVGMKVRVEDRADALAANASQREGAPAPGARVDDPETTAREHGRTCFGAVG